MLIIKPNKTISNDIGASEGDLRRSPVWSPYKLGGLVPIKYASEPPQFVLYRSRTKHHKYTYFHLDQSSDDKDMD